MSTINGLPNQTASTQNYHNYADVKALNELKQQAREDERAALKPVAQQFEALFVQQVLKEARKVSFDDGWLDSESGDFYKDWYDKQLSQDLSAKGTLGFADKIVEQLAPKHLNVAIKQDEEHNDNKADSLNQPPHKLSSTEQALSLRQLKP